MFYFSCVSLGCIDLKYFDYRRIILQTFFDEIPLFIREHKNGLYRTDVFYMSKLLTDLPLYSTINAMGMTMCYFSIGLYPATSRWLIAVGFVILTPLVAMGIGIICLFIK